MKVLLGKTAEKFLTGIPVAKSLITKDIKKAEKSVKKYPIVLKLISKKASHKTDIGGVKIVNNKAELEKEFLSLIKLTKKKRLPLEGILIQEFIKGREVIIGIKNDPAFGHAIMFGIGGTMVEVLKDVTFRICPITEEDAASMIEDLKAKQILYGTRGEKPVNIKLLKKILVSASLIPAKYKKIEELDINPLIINDKEAKAVDVRVAVK
jgi:succinyl-CoA synthetase beta subunit